MAGVPLLAPHLPDDKADLLYRGLEQESDDGGATANVLRQRSEEGHDDADRSSD